LVNHESGAVVGWCVTNIDITEQRQAKTALEAREHELSLIIETIPAFAWSASMLAVLPLASPCFAQSVPTQAPPTASAPQRPAYNLDRSEEDGQFLQDPSQREDFWDPLKYIPLGREGWYLTVAGEIRPFYEICHNCNWGAGPQSPNGYYLQRIVGSTDLHLGDRTRVFVELQSGDVFGRNGGLRPSQDKDTLDVSQAFVGLTVIPGDHKPKLELIRGRSETTGEDGQAALHWTDKVPG
jgi:hypothetical protein